MDFEIRELMSDHEQMSHIFLGCIPIEQLREIKTKYEKPGGNWRKDGTTIPVDMTIGGIPVNPKKFFDSWRNQMQRLINDEAKKLVTKKLGSQKMRDMRDKLNEYEQVLKSWEKDINWDAKNPLT